MSYMTGNAVILIIPK